MNLDETMEIAKLKYISTVNNGIPSKYSCEELSILARREFWKNREEEEHELSVDEINDLIENALKGQ